MMIAVLLLIGLTGCNFLNHGKPDAEIAIDLTQTGKAFPKDLYGQVFEKIKLNADIKGVADRGNLKTALNLAVRMIELENNVDSVGSISDSSALLKPFDQKAKRDLEGDYLQQSFHTPAYYALKMFSENRPDKLMPVKVSLNDENSTVKGIFATAGIHEKSGIVIIKLVNLDNTPRHCRIVLNYKNQIKYKGEVIVMTSGNNIDANSLKEPEKIVPMTKEVNGLRNTFNYECPANAIVIIHLRYKKGINGFVDCC